MSVFKNIYQEQYDKIEAQSKINDVSNTFALYQIFETALINSFYWKDLPKHIYFTRPEMHMYYRGLAGGFIDDDGLFQIYPAMPAGSLRNDGFYTEYIMIDAYGHNYRRSFEDMELLENIPNQIPTRPFVLYYCDRMKSVLNVIDVQLIKSQGGDIFEVQDEAQSRQVAELWDKMKKNIPIHTIMSENFTKRDINHLTLYDSRESQILDMWEIYDKYKHEFLTYMGINNVETEKKERLTTNEVDGNNDIIKHGFYETQYLCRLDFCRRCKEHFGTEFMVYKNRNEETVDNQQDFIEESASGDNAELIELNDETNETEIELETAETDEKESVDDGKDTTDSGE